MRSPIGTRLTFPSPFGVHVLKRKQERALQTDEARFPSPFGVHVLKWVKPLITGIPSLEVSVPFRGSRSEILVLQALILRGFKMLFAARIVFCPFPAATS